MTNAQVPLLDRCGTCGQPVPDVARCPHCGASLALDVVLSAPVTDPKQAYLLSRAVANLSLPGLGFSEARAAVGRAGAPLATSLARPQARALLAVLAGVGLAAEARPAMSKGPAAAGLGRRPHHLAGLGLVAVALGAAALITLRRATPVPSPAPAPSDPAAVGAVASPPVEPAAARTAALPVGAPPSSAGAPLAVSELLRRAMPATVQVSCQGQTGAGFFVTPELLLTNAHVVCGPEVPLEIVAGDGRAFIGRLVQRDEWVDWAVVKVPGAGATPLPLGDPTAVSPADPVVLIGAPKGLAGTVHEGKVSFVGRNLHGLSYVQVNADVNPGNSGGPLLDSQGRVIGIVSLKIVGADGMGMALPVEYARAALPDLPPLLPEGQARWEAVRGKAEAEDAAEVTRMRADLARPVLLNLRAAGTSALSVVVMQRFQGRTSSARLALELWDQGTQLCSPTATVTDWIDLKKKVKELSDPRTERRVAWLLRHDLLADVHAGGALAPLTGCPDTVPAGAKARLVNTEGDNAWAPVPAGLSGARGGEAGRSEAEAERARAAEGAQARRAEGEWRAAFAQARERVAQLESKRDQYRRELAAPRNGTTYLEARDNLPEVERHLKQAREQHEDLERQASRAGVPREWR